MVHGAGVNGGAEVTEGRDHWNVCVVAAVEWSHVVMVEVGGACGRSEEDDRLGGLGGACALGVRVK